MFDFITSPYVFSIFSALLVVIIPLYTIISFKIIKQQLADDIEQKIMLRSLFVKAVILAGLIFVSVNIFSKTIRYYTFDKHLVENEDNNIRYTLAYMEAVWESRKGKYYTIKEYTAGFRFSIDNVNYYQLHIVPEDFTNYTYFIKINLNDTNYSEILRTQLKLSSSFEVPASGWTSNPLTALSNHIMQD